MGKYTLLVDNEQWTVRKWLEFEITKDSNHRVRRRSQSQSIRDEAEIAGNPIDNRYEFCSFSVH